MPSFVLHCTLALGLLLTGSSTGFASPVTSPVVQNFPERFGIGGGAGGGRTPTVITMGEDDPGIIMETMVIRGGSVAFPERPTLFVTISEPNDFGDNRYGMVELAVDGKLEIKIPVGSKAGSINILEETHRFTSATTFTVEDGVVHFDEPLRYESGCRLTVHVKGSDKRPMRRIRGMYLIRGARPSLRRWDEETSSGYFGGLARRGKTQVYGPLVPSDRGWIVMECEGHATLQKLLPETFLPWGGDVELTLVMEPEAIVKLSPQVPEGRPVGNATMHLDFSHYPELGLSVPVPASGEAVQVSQLGIGTYHTLVNGKGLLPSVDVLEIKNAGSLANKKEIYLNAGLGVRGRVLSSDGSPIPDADVWIRPVTDRVWANPSEPGWPVFGGRFNPDCEWDGETDNHGSFYLSGFQRAKSFEVLVKAPPAGASIPEGLSKLKRRKYLRKHTSWMQVNNVAPDLQAIEIHVLPLAGGVHGDVVDSNGESISGYKVRAYADCDGPVLEELIASQEFDSRRLGPEIKPAKGKAGFHFPNLGAGKWAIHVSKQGHVSQVLRGVESGSKTLMVVMPKYGSLTGSIAIQEGTEDPACRLTIIDASGESVGYTIKQKFTIKDLAPGSYTVIPHVVDVGIGAPQVFQVRAAETCKMPRFDLLANGTVSGQLSAPLQSLPIKISLQPASSDGKRSRTKRPGWVITPSDKGSFTFRNILPGSYWLSDKYLDAEQPDARLGTGYRYLIEVSPDQKVEVRYGPQEADLEMHGTIEMDGAPFANNWLQLKHMQTGETFSAPTDSDGRYRIWAPAAGPYSLYACDGVIERSVRNSYLLATDWNVPGEPTQVDWVVPTATVRIEWVDQKGQPIRWVQIPKPAKAHWYPEHGESSFGRKAVIAQGGLISHLLPGTTYRIGLEANSLFGDLFEAREIPFQVPSDGSVPTIQVECVPFAVE